MPAPKLRQYSYFYDTAGWQTVVPAVATGRALVISKLTIATGTSCNISAAIHTTAGAGGTGQLFSGLPLNAGEYLTETGLVITSGRMLNVVSSAINTIIVNVFGQEVDD